MSALELREIHMRYGAHVVLERISLRVEDGELCVLVGPSGCGKSTLLRIVAGLIAPTEGDVLLDGERVNEREPADRDVAMVFQSYALYPHMSVEKNLAFPLRMARVPRREIDARVRDTAGLLGLEGLLQRKPAALSGGQMQRVAVGRAIIRNPRLFLFDEPLSNLDAQLRLQTRTELKKLHRELGTTMIYVTHDQSEAMTLGGRVAIMQRGAVVQAGPPLELYRTPVNTFVATFLGSPPMNLLKSFPDAANGARVTIGVRPEDIDVATSPAAGGDQAQVSVVEPMGSETLVTLDYRAQRLVARVPADRVFEPGQRAFVRFAPDRTLRFDETGARIR